MFGHSTSATGTGVYGKSEGAGVGVRGDTTEGVAVQGESFGSGPAGRFLGRVEVHGRLEGQGDAFFAGNVLVSGDIQLVDADCAEDFDIDPSDTIDPGTVMVIDTEGSLCSSHRSYDRRVAGFISGAGTYEPALVLDRQVSSRHRLPVALMGKVYCKADA